MEILGYIFYSQDAYMSDSHDFFLYKTKINGYLTSFPNDNIHG